MTQLCLIAAFLVVVKAIPICDIVSSTNVEEFSPDWSCFSNMLPQTNSCLWPGLHCEGNEITSVDISHSGISGNDFYGNLELYPNCCYVTSGTIPSTIQDLSFLSSLDIEGCSFHGIIVFSCRSF